MWLDWVGDLLSRTRCTACDRAVARRHVFCVGCAATVETCGPGEEGAVAFGHYGGALAEAVHQFKYRGAVHLARPLGHLLRRACRDAELAADVVVPVPLHRARLLERGYNQSALLAAHVADEVGAPLCTRVLARRVATPPQADLDREERLTNVRGVFAVHPRRAQLVRGRRVALVDDVATTGATLASAASTLMAAGARSVAHVVLARTLKGK